VLEANRLVFTTTGFGFFLGSSFMDHFTILPISKL